LFGERTEGSLAQRFREAMGLADEGRFQDAVEFLRGVRGVDGLRKVLSLLAGRTGADEGLDGESGRQWLDRQAEALDMEVAYSSIAGPVLGNRPGWEEDFRVAGTGAAQFSSSMVALEAIGAQEVRLELDRDLPEAPTVVAHVLLSFPSHTARGFYVRFCGEGGEESFRFSSQGMVVCNDHRVLQTPSRYCKLYSIVLDKDRVSVFVNGVLRVRRGRSQRVRYRRLVMELLGTAAADSGGVVHGLEIWSGSKPIPLLLPDDVDVSRELFADEVRRGQGDRVHDYLKLIQGLDAPELHGDALAMLEELLDRGTYREWIFDAVLDWVSPARARQWRMDNADRFPDPLVEVRDLTVTFSRSPHRAMSLKRLFSKRSSETFNVLEGVRMTLYRGDILGIIGANGAGKSTLLRTLAGLVPIRRGEVLLRGEHLLLSAGLGIRPELSGRENIYLGGCFMGLSPRQLRHRFDEIVDFAELREVIDRPFKFYSDGMKARLIFSLATSISPEVLMLDELLSAGDIRFQQKAARRMDELIGRSKLVIVVTHGMQFIRNHCTKALYLRSGKPVFFGEPEEAVARYISDLRLTPGQTSEVSADQLAAMQQMVSTMPT
jgi:ABC-type polysaccharide/polyol phosphate transport system ATPase subunit